MEVDFGESWVDIAGAPCKVKYLVATLPHSNTYFAKAYPIITELEADLPTRHLHDGRSVAEALTQERQHLRAMPVHLPGTCRVVPRVADKFGHVRVDHVTYSVPIHHAYRPV